MCLLFTELLQCVWLCSCYNTQIIWINDLNNPMEVNQKIALYIKVNKTKTAMRVNIKRVLPTYQCSTQILITSRIWRLQEVKRRVQDHSGGKKQTAGMNVGKSFRQLKIQTLNLANSCPPQPGWHSQSSTATYCYLYAPKWRKIKGHMAPEQNQLHQYGRTRRKEAGTTYRAVSWQVGFLRSEGAGRGCQL